MSYKIENVLATIPVTGQSYTDIRPTISGDSIEDIKEGLAEMGRVAGNTAFTDRMTGMTDKDGMIVKSHDGVKVWFNEDEHLYYDKYGKEYTSGSQFAEQAMKPFNAEMIAKGDQDKINMWNMKGELARLFGSTIHKAVELAIKYGESSSHPWVKEVVDDLISQLGDTSKLYTEVFIASEKLKACGVVDCLEALNPDKKEVALIDFKTGDIYKKAQLTKEAKEKWPTLKNEVLSGYILQLNWYRKILEDRGYTVSGMGIWHLVGDAWQNVEVERVEV